MRLWICHSIALAAWLILLDVSAAATCATVPGADAAIKSGRHFLVFGESHGTREMPQAFGEIVCAISTARPVVVALEFPESVTPAFAAYLASKGGEVERIKLFKAAQWAKGHQDGRKSLAMFAMIERLRGLRASGARIELVGFVRPTSPPDQAQHELGMANGLTDLSRRNKGSQIVVLVGALHAQRDPETYRTGLKPMAALLPADQLMSVRFTHQGGKAWGCKKTAAATPDCRIHDRMAEAVPETSPSFDGFLNVGSITASPPAADLAK